MMGRKKGKVSKPQKEDKHKLKKAVETDIDAAAGTSGNKEYKSLAEGGPRVKFTSHWNGDLASFISRLSDVAKAEFEEEVQLMANAVSELESTGAAPILPDGKVGGNVAWRFKPDDQEEVIIVSKSGKATGEKFDIENDVCIVTKFDTEGWGCEYLSVSDKVLPTSDSPMHHAALNAHKKFNWSEIPNAILHGHAFETEEKAREHGFPISTEETLFSTPEDTSALMALFQDHPYPENKMFIRKGHGFLLLDKSLKDAFENFKTNIEPKL